MKTARSKLIRVDEQTSERFAEAKRLRKWSYTTIAAEAIQSLFKSDPVLSAVPPRRRRVAG
jgi:hypothetical protein